MVVLSVVGLTTLVYTQDIQPQESQVDIVPNPNYGPSTIGYVKAVSLSVHQNAGTEHAVVGHVFFGDRLDIYEGKTIDNRVWYRINDEAGYIDGWVVSGYIIDTPPRVQDVPQNSGLGLPLRINDPIPSEARLNRTPSVRMNFNAKFVGSVTCAECHNEPHGPFPLGEYGVWEDHYHAFAYNMLERRYSKALAAERGYDSMDGQCLKCHATAYGVPQERLGPNYSHEEGVGCETCHGPGGDYLQSHWAGQPGFNLREARGFRIIRNLEERDQFCRSCHNPLSPTFRSFNVKAFSDDIRHWNEQIDEEFINRPLLLASAESALLPPGQGLTNPVIQPTPSVPNKKPPLITPINPAAGPAERMLNTSGLKKGPVFFPHQFHSEVFQCQVCHHTMSSGDQPEACRSCHPDQATEEAPNRKLAFHGRPGLQNPSSGCKQCHRDLGGGGPTKCSQCHNAGRIN